MKKTVFSILLGLLCVKFAFSQNTSNPADALITENGWGNIKLGTSSSEIENILGKPDLFGETPSYTSFAYDAYNVVIFVRKATDKVFSIWFTDLDLERVYKFNTDKGINQDSTKEDVLKLYGKPKKIQESPTSSVLIYETIRFRFAGKRIQVISIYVEGQ
jgi:hypothetical protein